MADSCDEAPAPLTPFERKYRDSDQLLYRVVTELAASPSGEQA